jgi:hypothetical protein
MDLSASRSAVLIVVACLVAALDAQDSRQMGGVGLRVFEHAEFAGQSATLTRDTPDFRSIGLNDTVSSLRVIGGQSWEACENIEYNDCRVVSGDISNLRSVGLREMISTVRPLGRPR